MKTLPERLRDPEMCIDACDEAAAELERLREDNERLTEILRSAPNPYNDNFQLSRYKGWWALDRGRNLPVERKQK